MLVLSRRCGESIRIGDDIEIQVVVVRGAGEQAVVRVGINAPRNVTILREEVYQAVVEANRQAMGPGVLGGQLRRAVAGDEVVAATPAKATSRPRRTARSKEAVS